MSLGEWVIVSILLLHKYGLGWEYFITMGLLLVLMIVLKEIGVIE